VVISNDRNPKIRDKIRMEKKEKKKRKREERSRR